MDLIERLSMEKVYEERLFLTPQARNVLCGFYDSLESEKDKEGFVVFLKSTWVQMETCYKKTDDPIERVLETYELFDQAVSMDKETFQGEVTCKKGCSYCCYLHVTVNPDEAELLAAKANEFGVDIERLKKQAPYDDSKEWLKMPLEDRKCVFLEDGECGIYEDRPLSCRNYRVTGDAKECDTSKGSILVSQVLYPLAEWVHCVAMSLTGAKQESMAYGIIKRIQPQQGMPLRDGLRNKPDSQLLPKA